MDGCVEGETLGGTPLRVELGEGRGVGHRPDDGCGLVSGASEVAARLERLQLVAKARQDLAPAAYKSVRGLGQLLPASRGRQSLSEQVLGAETTHHQTCDSRPIELIELLGQPSHCLQWRETRQALEQAQQLVSCDDPYRTLCP